MVKNNNLQLTHLLRCSILIVVKLDKRGRLTINIEDTGLRGPGLGP